MINPDSLTALDLALKSGSAIAALFGYMWYLERQERKALQTELREIVPKISAALIELANLIKSKVV